MKTNPELASLIHQFNPYLAETDILRGVAKLRKLAKTILKRTDPFIYGGSGEVYTRNTLKFYAKAHKVAVGIGCAFMPLQPVLRGYVAPAVLIGDIEEPLV